MTRGPILNPRGDWVGLIEAINAESKSDGEWADAIMYAALPLFPRAISFMVYALNFDANRHFVGVRFDPKGTDTHYFQDFQRYAAAEEQALVPFHFGPPVLTMDEGMRALGRERAHEVAEVRRTLATEMRLASSRIRFRAWSPSSRRSSTAESSFRERSASC